MSIESTKQTSNGAVERSWINKSVIQSVRGSAGDLHGLGSPNPRLIFVHLQIEGTIIQQSSSLDLRGLDQLKLLLIWQVAS